MCSTIKVDNWSDLGTDEGLRCAVTIKCKAEPTSRRTASNVSRLNVSLPSQTRKNLRCVYRSLKTACHGLLQSVCGGVLLVFARMNQPTLQRRVENTTVESTANNSEAVDEGRRHRAPPCFKWR